MLYSVPVLGIWINQCSWCLRHVFTLTAVVDGTRPESFFHVAIKNNDLDASESLHWDHFDREVIERGDATDGMGATTVNHITSR